MTVHKNNGRKKSRHNERQRRLYLGAVALALFASLVSQTASPSFSSAEQEVSEQPPQLSKEQKIAMLRHEQQSMKMILEDERASLKDSLDIRLQEIEENQEGPAARREAVQQWKQDARNLKAAYKEAWRENADELGALLGRTPARRSSGAIEMYKAPKTSVRGRCPKSTRTVKGRCRKKIRRRRSCRRRRCR